MFSTKLKCFNFLRRAVIHKHSVPRVVCQSTMSSAYPTTLKEFGYAFNDAGQLRQIDPEDNSITDLPYKFEVTSNARENQAHYEAIGEVITEHVYQMLMDAGLHKIYVPSPETLDSSFVFATRTSFENTKKLLILIHGSGVVRAGQWSRSLIINQSADHGTQLPYIKRAIELGYDVLVTNTNKNYRIEEDARVRLPGNESPEKHIISVWEQLIAPVFDTIESFAVVAHSYGGVVTLHMAEEYSEEFLAKCFAVGFTDSVHFAGSLSSEMLEWFQNNARNFVTSSKPLNEFLDSRSSDIPCYSAGHTKHEWTSWACIEVLFPFLEEKYTRFSKSKLSGGDATGKDDSTNQPANEQTEDAPEGGTKDEPENDQNEEKKDQKEDPKGDSKNREDL